MDAALACAKAEAGFLAESDDTRATRRALLEEGAALAAETSNSTYLDLSAALAAELDASAPGDVSDEAMAAADRLLDQCALDGFERLQ